MFCPLCKKSDTKVLDSRDENFLIKRRRECLKCKYRFTTFERIEAPKIRVVKRNGILEDYCHEKMARGVKLALEKRPFSNREIDEIISNIEQKIIQMGKKAIPTLKIGEIVVSELKKVDDVAYLRFISVFKNFGSAKKFQKEAEKLFN